MPVGVPGVPPAMKLRLHFVVDPMGWMCIGAVFGVWLFNTLFIPKLVLFPHYNEGHIPWLIVVCECPCSRSRNVFVDTQENRFTRLVKLNIVYSFRLLYSIGALPSSPVQSFYSRSRPSSSRSPHTSLRYGFR